MILKSSVNECGAELILGARLPDSSTHALLTGMLSTGSFKFCFFFCSQKILANESLSDFL